MLRCIDDLNRTTKRKIEQGEVSEDSRMVLTAMDAVALCPSLDKESVAEVVMEETVRKDLDFGEINYDKCLRYLAIKCDND